MNFLDLEPERSDPEGSAAAVLPVPYEMTTTYGAGTAKGPAAIIAASAQVEYYDELRGCSPATEFGIATLDAFAPAGASPEDCVGEIAGAVARELRDDRLLCVLGGEHSLSAGVARALAGGDAPGGGGGGDLCAVVLDAHADMRPEYELSPYSHACAVRRISELMPVLVVGVRSMSAECDEYLYGEGASRAEVVFAHEMAGGVPAALIAGFCGGKRVYLSIDVDALDPSIMPATGTPEPGGLGWWQALGVIDEVARAATEIVAVDVVELSPIEGLAAPDFLAARLAYKAITAAVTGPAGAAGAAGAAS